LVAGGAAGVPGAPACPPGDMFQMDRGGVHMDLIDGTDAIRLTDPQLRAHPRWWGLPDGHVPMRGLLGVRLAGRGGHFMNPALLDSQFATLEEPRDAIVVDVEDTPEALVGAIRAGLAQNPRLADAAPG